MRGSIDLTRLASSLAAARGTSADDWYVGLDAALVALSGRIRLAESSSRPPEDVIRELYEDVFGPPPSDDEPGADEAGGDPPGEAAARQGRAAS